MYINLLYLPLFYSAYLFFLSFLFSFPPNIFVSFTFIALFHNWHLALVLFSSLCLSQFCSGRYNFRLPLFARSIQSTLFLFYCFYFTYRCIYMCVCVCIQSHFLLLLYTSASSLGFYRSVEFSFSLSLSSFLFHFFLPFLFFIILIFNFLTYSIFHLFLCLLSYSSFLLAVNL